MYLLARNKKVERQTIRRNLTSAQMGSPADVPSVDEVVEGMLQRLPEHQTVVLLKSGLGALVHGIVESAIGEVGGLLITQAAIVSKNLQTGQT